MILVYMETQTQTFTISNQPKYDSNKNSSFRRQFLSILAWLNLNPLRNVDCYYFFNDDNDDMMMSYILTILVNPLQNFFVPNQYEHEHRPIDCKPSKEVA